MARSDSLRIAAELPEFKVSVLEYLHYGFQTHAAFSCFSKS